MKPRPLWDVDSVPRCAKPCCPYYGPERECVKIDPIHIASRAVLIGRVQESQFTLRVICESMRGIASTAEQRGSPVFVRGGLTSLDLLRRIAITQIAELHSIVNAFDRELETPEK